MLPALAGMAMLAAPASADTLDPGAAAVVPARTEATVSALPTAEAMAAERRALLVEAAMSAPTLGLPAAAVAPAALVAPEVTAAQLRHVPAALVDSIIAAAKKYRLS